MIHRVFGYFMIMAVQVAVISGITRYQSILPAQNLAVKRGLVAGNVLFWVLAIATGEILLWKRHKSIVLFRTVEKFMNRAEFVSAI